MDIDSVDKMCQKILNDAQKEAEQIIANAEKRVQSQLAEAEQIALKKEVSINENTQKEIDLQKRNVLSSYKFELKRKVLMAKQQLFENVFSHVISLMQNLRTKPEYSEIVMHLIAEAIQVLNVKNVSIHVSDAESKDLETTIKKELPILLKNTYSLDVIFNVVFDANIQDMGAIVYSTDNQVVYNNTLTTRMKRMKNELYMQIHSFFQDTINKLDAIEKTTQ